MLLLVVVSRGSTKDNPDPARLGSGGLTGVGLSAIGASPTGNGLYDLGLFTVVADDQMTDVDDALARGVQALLAPLRGDLCRIVHVDFAE
jgi:hypothetical protein